MRIQAAALAMLIGLSAAPAAAQPAWMDEPGYQRGLSTRTIMRIVRARGLDPVSQPMRRGGYYTVTAENDFGDLRRVVIDAGSGRIVAIHSAARREAPYGPRYGGRPRYDDDEPGYGMRPPRRAPDRWAAYPREPFEDDDDLFRRPVPPGPTARPRREPRTVAVAPTSPPIPRPRPADVSSVEPPAAEKPGGEPQTTAAATPDKPAATPAKRRGLPRIVLPGGPLPKAERTAEHSPAGRQQEPSAVPAPEAPAAAPAIPPVQPLD